MPIAWCPPVRDLPRQQGWERGARERSSDAREQKGINHLAVIRGSLSTGCLGAFLLPYLRVPQFAVLRQTPASRAHEPSVQAAPAALHSPRSLQPLPTPANHHGMMGHLGGNGCFLIAFSALLPGRPVKAEPASHLAPAPGWKLPSRG